MKQKTIILLFVTALVSTLASCLSSDDNTPTDFSAEYKSAIGQYPGNMYALDFKDALKTDTLKHTVTATLSADSLITFTDFPLYFVAKELSNEKLREAIVAKGNTTMKAKFAIYNSNGNYVFASIYPLTVTLNDVDYEGSKHKVAFSFIYPTQGYFSPAKYLHIPMYIGGVYLDDVLLEDFTKSKNVSQILIQFQGGTN